MKAPVSKSQTQPFLNLSSTYTERSHATGYHRIPSDVGIHGNEDEYATALSAHAPLLIFLKCHQAAEAHVPSFFKQVRSPRKTSNTLKATGERYVSSSPVSSPWTSTGVTITENHFHRLKQKVSSFCEDRKVVKGVSLALWIFPSEVVLAKEITLYRTKGRKKVFFFHCKVKVCSRSRCSSIYKKMRERMIEYSFFLLNIVAGLRGT